MPDFPRRAKLKVRDGEYLYVTVHPGFIGAEFRNREVGFFIELPRDTAVQLLKWLVPIVRQMPTSTDPITVLRDQRFIDDEQSRLRRERRRSPRRSKKRAR